MSINTHVASTLAGKAPPDYRQSFSLAAEVGAFSPDLAERLAPSAGLRNLLVHEYGSIDLDRLAQAVPTALNNYRAYVRQMATFLRDRTG
ncbi:MAG: DUF86 domain-containing protein [Actinomycetota bacterium]|nr:DUF86 domain-containing protein [Actinomycetota bacterium]